MTVPSSQDPPPAGASPPAPARRRRSRWSILVITLAWLVLAVAGVWATLALWFDVRIEALRLPLATAYVVAFLAIPIATPRQRWALPTSAALFLIVLGWWFTLKPTNDADWQPDVATLPWAEFKGEQVTVHNVRNCLYRTEADYDVRLEDRTYDLSRIQSLDLFLVHWGSPLIAHTMVSFGFEGGDYLCISIEVRKKKGQSYSALRGFFRQFELTYIIADERDLVALRTDFRKGEDVYLYRLNPLPGMPRKILTAYLENATEFRDHPHWYNAATSNCTTNIFVNADEARGNKIPFDWRMLANGYIDELLFERGKIVGTGPFPDLKARAYINPKASKLPLDEHFSAAIREGVTPP